MKALVLNMDGAAPSLDERDIPTPRLRDSDVLVQVAACGVCHHDLAVLDGKLRRGVKPDVVLGHEISGVVADVGDAVSAVRPGDRVVAALTRILRRMRPLQARARVSLHTRQGLRTRARRRLRAVR